MPILSHSSRRAVSQRLSVCAIYMLLSILGLSMVVPFLITLTLSVSGAYDSSRYNVVPRYLYSREDRFVKFLSGYFNDYAGWQGQLAANFPDVPASWSNWKVIGDDSDGIAKLARLHLDQSPGQWALAKIRARDYADFCETYSMDNSVALIDGVFAEQYLTDQFARRWVEENPARSSASAGERRAGALAVLRDTWKIPFTDFNQINFRLEMQAPMWQQSWLPPGDPKARSFAELKQACRDLRGMPGIHSKWIAFLRKNGIAGDNIPLAPESPAPARESWLKFKEEVAPASIAIPYASRVDWRRYLQSNAVRESLHMGRTEIFDIAYYNRLAGTRYQSWFETPFPLPADAPAALQQLWAGYVLDYFPIRLTTVAVTPDLTSRYQLFMQNRFKTITVANQFFGSSAVQWTDFPLGSSPPAGAGTAGLRNVWADFVKTIPFSSKQLHSSESDFQEFILKRYGKLDAVNQAWGTHYAVTEEIFPPFAQAYQVTFRQNEGAFVFHSLTGNYTAVSFYLFRHANAVPVTLFLIFLSILSSLTINPMAAYALSRFNMRGQDKIILFFLATSAFPAMISAIPGFLLMRDLGMLNTFFALILPGAANGLGIFILKGFFDSLPPELFEAATIDGAKEWQIFLHVTMPMVKPILAVNALGAFIGAYEGWQWALVVCQNSRMWTLAVWMYQFSQSARATPGLSSAGYVIISIPTLIVFLTCQRIILRGIIIPQMK